MINHKFKIGQLIKYYFTHHECGDAIGIVTEITEHTRIPKEPLYRVYWLRETDKENSALWGAYMGTYYREYQLMHIDKPEEQC